MTKEPPLSRAARIIFWFIGTPRGSAWFYGVFFIALASGFVREPRDSLDFAWGLTTTITGALCLVAGLLWREGRMYWVRWGMVVLLGSTGILTILLLIYKIRDLYFML